jgi:hypothetical protein
MSSATGASSAAGANRITHGRNQVSKADVKRELYENQLCSSVGATLQNLYPGWRWWVDCTLPSGMIAVRNLDLDGDYGFYVPVAKYVQADQPAKIIMRAGGEILERYKQHRGRRIASDQDIARDFKGVAKGDKN